MSFFDRDPDPSWVAAVIILVILAATILTGFSPLFTS